MEHLKKFERFVQQKADTIRRELDSNKPAKIVRQLEVIAQFVGAADAVSLGSSLSPSTSQTSYEDAAPTNNDSAPPASLTKQHIPSAVFKRSTKWVAACLDDSEAPHSVAPVKTGVFASMNDDVYAMLTCLHIDDSHGLNGQQLAHIMRLLSGPRGTWSGVLRRFLLERCSLPPLTQSCCHFLSSPTAATLTHITLRGASLGDDSVSYFIDAILSSTTSGDGGVAPHLMELDLSGNHITLAAPLAKLLVLHPAIRLLDISCNFLGAAQSNVDEVGPASKTTGGFLSELATKLENTFKGNSHQPKPATKRTTALGASDIDEEAAATTSRFFVEEEHDCGEDDDVDATLPKPTNESMYVLVKELLRPRDDLWAPDTMWAGSIRTIVATNNGVTAGCIASLQKLFDRDCAAIYERGEQERQLRVTVENPSLNLVTEENAHLFVPGLHFSRLILSEEQLAVLSEHHGTEVPRSSSSHVTYTANGIAQPGSGDGKSGACSPVVACSRLGRTVATRRKHIRQWLCGNEDGVAESPPPQLSHAPSAQKDCTTITMPRVGSVSDSLVSAPKSDASSTQLQDSTASLHHAMAGSIGVTAASCLDGMSRRHLVESDAIETIMAAQLQCSIEHCALLVECEREGSRIQQREVIHDMLRSHALHVRNVALEMEQQLSRAREIAHSQSEAKCALEKEKCARLERQLEEMVAAKDRMWDGAVQQLQLWDRTMVGPAEHHLRAVPAPPIVTSVGCSTDLQMVELEEWRQQRIKRREDRRRAQLLQKKNEESVARPREETLCAREHPPAVQDPHTPSRAPRPPAAASDDDDDDESDDIVPDSTNTFEIVQRIDDSFAMMTKDQWQNDTEATKCNQCGRAFDLLHRRHHCRRCGSVQCSKCAPKSALHGDVRICKGCTSVAGGGSRRSSMVGKRDR
jgi:hypothetical protein